MMGILLIVLLLVMVGIELNCIFDKLFSRKDQLYFREVETGCMYEPFPPRNKPSSKRS